MPIQSETHAAAILKVEVTNVSQHGFLILLNEKLTCPLLQQIGTSSPRLAAPFKWEAEHNSEE